MPAAIILPARKASVRLPNKLLLNRTGKTLLEHTVGQARLACEKRPDFFSELIVACDHPELAAAAKNAGAAVVMTSPDCPSGTDRIAEAAKTLPSEINLIVNLQADEPELDPELIYKAAKALEDALSFPDRAKSETERKDSSGRIVMATLASPIVQSIENQAF